MMNANHANVVVDIERDGTGNLTYIHLCSVWGLENNQAYGEEGAVFIRMPVDKLNDVVQAVQWMVL